LHHVGVSPQKLFLPDCYENHHYTASDSNLTTKTNGWHDITVLVQGGGMMRAYEARLSFDGSTYLTNPSVPPARELVEKALGEVVIPSTGEDKPLF
jgi:hypothetical protein